MSHTPAPWEVYCPGRKFVVTKRNFVSVCEVTEDEETRSSETAMANARLIAAAPELLAYAECLQASFAYDQPGTGFTADQFLKVVKMSDIIQGTPEWIEARRGLITASIAGACLGLDPHTSARKAWRTILGLQSDADNAYMRYGRDNEARALGDYDRISGTKRQPGSFFVHPQMWWLAASPDALIGDSGLAEAKCPGTLPTKIPIPHLIQCKIQLACTGRAWCDYFAWLRTSEDSYDYFLRRVDRAGIDGIVRRLWAWYQSYIIANVEPPTKKRKSSQNGAASFIPPWKQVDCERLQ